MDLLKLFQKALDEVEGNLSNESLSADYLARKEALSSFYFQRLFYIYSSLSVAEYIRNRRLSEAGQRLHRNPEASIIETGLEYGYSSQESFSKAFKRFHGCTPKEAKEGAPLQYFPRLDIIVTIKGGKAMDYSIEEEKAFEIVIWTRKFSSGTSNKEIPLFWDEYAKKGYDKDVPPMLGVCIEGNGEDTCSSFEYGIGSIKECVKSVPEGFAVRKVPAGTWAKFYTHGPDPEAIQQLWSDVYKKWLPGSGYEVVPGFDFECYDEGDVRDPSYRSGIWLRVRKVD